MVELCIFMSAGIRKCCILQSTILPWMLLAWVGGNYQNREKPTAFNQLVTACNFGNYIKKVDEFISVYSCAQHLNSTNIALHFSRNRNYSIYCYNSLNCNINESFSNMVRALVKDVHVVHGHKTRSWNIVISAMISPHSRLIIVWFMQVAGKSLGELLVD